MLLARRRRQRPALRTTDRPAEAGPPETRLGCPPLAGGWRSSLGPRLYKDVLSASSSNISRCGHRCKPEGVAELWGTWLSKRP